MRESFSSYTSRIFEQRMRQIKLQLKFGDNEQDALKLFYNYEQDEEVGPVPMFRIYWEFCAAQHPSLWDLTLVRADQAVRNLVSIGYIREDSSLNRPPLSQARLGTSVAIYRLETEGLKVLQGWKPPLSEVIRQKLTSSPNVLGYWSAFSTAISIPLALILFFIGRQWDWLA